MTLKKSLGLPEVFSVAAGAMISSGLFVLPGLAFAKSGPAVILAYFLAAIFVIPTMLAKAELATAMPKAGGTYFFIERSLGPVMGTYGGLANWFSLSFKSAFALVGIGAFASIIDPEITVMQIKLIALGACLIFTALNLLSVKEAGRIQVLLVFSLVTLLILYVGKGFITTHPDRYVPFFPKGFGPILHTTGLVFVSFGGLTKVASIAEEVKNPTRNIPLGMFLALFVVSLLYILSIGVTVGIVDGGELSGSLIPLSLGAKNIMGAGGMIVLSVAAIIAFITTANAGILSASRSPMAMGRDELLPAFFSRVNKRYHTPHVAILFTCGFMVCVILFLGIEDLVKTASSLMIILFILVNISTIVMRESRIKNYRPKFKMPWYPWLPIGAVIVYIFLLIEMGWIPIFISVDFFIIGWLGYWTYARVRVKRKSALMHIVERVTAKELKSKTLSQELRDIVIERDDIVEDRFDRLVRACPILDLDEAGSVENIFQRISAMMEDRVGLNAEILFEKFMEREQQSCTVIKSGLAIPHIIVPGENKFEIMLVRIRRGVVFSCAPDPVFTMFVLVGSYDERNYHLRALMAIAQIAQEAVFEDKWKEADNEEELRDIILLSARKRDGQTSPGA